MLYIGNMSKHHHRSGRKLTNKAYSCSSKDMEGFDSSRCLDNVRWELFCYHRSSMPPKSSVECYRLAGFKASVKDQSACRLNSHPKVKARIEYLRNFNYDEMVMSKCEAEVILSKQARGNLQTLMRSDGSIDIGKIDETVETYESSEKGVRVKLCDRRGAIETLGKLKGWSVGSDESRVSVNVDARSVVDASTLEAYRAVLSRRLAAEKRLGLPIDERGESRLSELNAELSKCSGMVVDA